MGIFLFINSSPEIGIVNVLHTKQEGVAFGRFSQFFVELLNLGPGQYSTTDETRPNSSSPLYITSINVTHFMSQVRDNTGRFFQ
jgi:hypothetical protein